MVRFAIGLLIALVFPTVINADLYDCGAFTTEGECPNEPYAGRPCQWLRGKCRYQCGWMGSSDEAACTAAPHCLFVKSPQPVCAYNCNFTITYCQSRQSGSDYCSANKNHQCQITCGAFDGDECPTASRLGQQPRDDSACTVVPSSGSKSVCMQDCLFYKSSASCNEERNCEWNEAVDQCSTRCSAFDAHNCPNSTTNNTCAAITSPTYSRYKCRENCSFYATQSACNTQPAHCLWMKSTGTCELQCTEFVSVDTCPSYCWKKKSTYYTPSSCLPLCSDAKTQDTCGGEGDFSDCAWNSAASQCEVSCNLFRDLNCPTAEDSHYACVMVYAKVYGACQRNCSGFTTKMNCDEHTDCLWVSENNTCNLACEQYAGPASCPSYCWSTRNSCNRYCNFAKSSTECNSQLYNNCNWNSWWGQCMTHCSTMNAVSCANATASPFRPLNDTCSVMPSSDPHQQCTRNCSAYTTEDMCTTLSADCFWRDGKCNIQCNAFFKSSSCPSYCWKAKAPNSYGQTCFRYCSSATTSAECIPNQFSQPCEWNANNNQCQTHCSYFSSDICPGGTTLRGKDACTLVHSTQSNYQCQRNCSVFTSEGSCKQQSSTCVWISGKCLLQCKHYHYVRSCPSHCWLVKAPDSFKSCLPYCDAVSSRSECKSLPTCEWNGVTDRCQISCSKFSGDNCPNAATMGSGQPANDTCTQVASTSIIYQCQRNCSVFTSEGSCKQQSSCTWRSHQCRLGCDEYQFTNSCPFYCTFRGADQFWSCSTIPETPAPPPTPAPVFLVYSHLLLAGNFEQMIDDRAKRDTLSDALRTDLSSAVDTHRDNVEVTQLTVVKSTVEAFDATTMKNLLVNFTVQTTEFFEVEVRIANINDNNHAKEFAATINAYEELGGNKNAFKLLNATVDDATFYTAPKTESPTPKTESPSDDTTLDGHDPHAIPLSALVGGAIGGLVLLILIIAALVIYIVRSKKESDSAAKEDPPAMDQDKDGAELKDVEYTQV